MVRSEDVPVLSVNTVYCLIWICAQLQIREGIHIIFLFLHENIYCGYSLEAPA